MLGRARREVFHGVINRCDKLPSLKNGCCTPRSPSWKHLDRKIDEVDSDRSDEVHEGADATEANRPLRYSRARIREAKSKTRKIPKGMLLAGRVGPC